MAAIGKIRQNSGLLLIVIGGAMVAFVLSDMFSQGGRVQQQYVGEIDGTSIDRMVYEQRVQKELESRNSLGQPTSPQVTESIRNTVWNNMIREMVMRPQMQKAGVLVTPDEFDDLTLGDNMLPEFRNDPTFVNPETGEFDRDLVRQYLDFVRTTPQYRAYWELQRERILNQRMYDKYHNMIKRGLVANQIDARNEYNAAKRTANIRYVMKEYASIDDADVNFTESELKSYFNERKGEARFKQGESRTFDYILFNVKPSADDSVAIQNYLREMIPDFEQTRRDSVFVMNNSDARTYQVIVHKPGMMDDEALDAMIMEADSGKVVGPYLQGNSYVISKVLGDVQEEQARVRHILLSTDGKDKDEVKSRADSLLRVVKRQKNFEEMVTQFSEDPGSVSTGGVYEWFNRERMVPEFTAASFDEPVGAITIAETQYGFHIVEVLGQRKEDQRRIVSLTRNIEPSNESMEEAYQEANAFSLNYDSHSRFLEGAESAGYTVETATDISRLANMVGQINNPTDLVRWAFGAKVGQVSEPIEIDTKIVVAVLTGKKEEGIASFEDVRDVIEAEVIKNKKAEMLIAEMQGITDLKELATAVGAGQRTAQNISFSNTNIGGSSEPAVVAKVLTLESGLVSVPLKGERGVYVVEVENITEPMEVDSFDSEIRSLNSRMASRVNAEVFNALKEKANVRDDRAKFY
ncbi:MAG: hypothetical protein EA392_03265 [Cryomorphaceae bacterium]|nr:MAG: hypothetical protein EA392_03265 [Cryomorphaceae bacterium]